VGAPATGDASAEAQDAKTSEVSETSEVLKIQYEEERYHHEDAVAGLWLPRGNHGAGRLPLNRNGTGLENLTPDPGWERKFYHAFLSSEVIMRRMVNLN
jgi:hypothetical protein